MKYWIKTGLFVFLILFFCETSQTNSFVWGNDSTISLESLLREMTNYNAVCEFPCPGFICKQASSYDRGAVAPDQPGWFANADASQFIRIEDNNGRTESVLFDAEGPGAVVRFWITAPHYKNNFYFYFDGEEEPSIQGKVDDLIGGNLLTEAPLSSPRARGRNLYLPIPYSKSLKITCDKMEEQGNLYYQINYRTYSQETNVVSFSWEQMENLKGAIAATNQLLLMKSEEKGVYCLDCLGSSGAFIDIDEPDKAIEAIEFRLKAEDEAAALRNTVIKIEFDGEETVWCPVSEFFGSGVGINPNKTWYTMTEEQGTMTCFWTMPFKEDAKISFETFGDQKVHLYFKVYFSDYQWTDNSMYFHCNWRQERNIETVAGNGTRDWNYLEVEGQGVYVGDILTLLNRDTAWWGEGDEKIYIDQESFPSHFGTGTEDYYGYAWGSPDFFDAPFHAQPRAEGPVNFGNITNLRYRSLDKIPFNETFKFDIEVWHWAKTTVDYAVTTFWYGMPGAKAVNVPSQAELIEEVSQKVSYKTKFEIKIPGFTIANEPNGRVQEQNMKDLSREGHQWKGDKQLWWTEAQPGDSLVLTIPIEKANPKSLRLGLTSARDYGLFELYLDGQKIGGTIDLFQPDSVDHKIFVIEELPELTVGDHSLEIKIVGKNDQSIGYMFGIDFYELIQ